jgi:hypothetical protein
MNTVTTLLATTVLLASTSTIALAQADAVEGQDDGVATEAGESAAGAEGETNAEPPGVELEDDPHAEAAGVAEIDYDAIVSGLQTSGATAADIEAVTAEDNVQVVLLSELRVQAAENEAAIDEALASFEQGIEDLRTAIADNTEVMAALGAQGYDASAVVGVTTAEESGLVLVVDDSQ